MTFGAKPHAQGWIKTGKNTSAYGASGRNVSEMTSVTPIRSRFDRKDIRSGREARVYNAGRGGSSYFLRGRGPTVQTGNGRKEKLVAAAGLARGED